MTSAMGRSVVRLALSYRLSTGMHREPHGDVLGGMKAPTPPTRKPYPSDLRDGEWTLLEPLVPAIKTGGRPARRSRREIVNAILYVVPGGNQWRALPHDLLPWQTAYYYSTNTRSSPARR
jgi:hypothetical protein